MNVFKYNTSSDLYCNNRLIQYECFQIQHFIRFKNSEINIQHQQQQRELHGTRLDFLLRFLHFL